MTALSHETLDLMVLATHLKNMIVKLDHFPKVRGEN